MLHWMHSRWARSPTSAHFSSQTNPATGVSLALLTTLSLAYFDSPAAYGTAIWDEMKDMADTGLRQHPSSTVADAGIKRLKFLCYSSGRLFDHYELVAGRIADAYAKIQLERTNIRYVGLRYGGPRSVVRMQPREEEAIRKELSWVQRVGPMIRLLFCPGTTRYLYMRKEKTPTHLASKIIYSPFAQVCLWPGSKSARPDPGRRSTTPLPSHLARSPPGSERATEMISRLRVSFVLGIRLNAR